MPSRGSRVLAVLGILAVGSVAAVAHADAEPHAEDRALATALFKEGRALIEEGRVAEACRKFEESQRLDPGGGTLLNLAECRGREGRTATAWAEFTEALAQARREGRADRVEVATARITALEPHLSHLSIVVEGPSDRDGLEVTIDGTDVRRPAWGMAVPIDPGAHAIEARAPGMRPWRATVTVGAEGDASRVAVPPLEPVPPEPRVSEAPEHVPGEPVRARVPLVRDAAMVGAGVIGVASVVVGSYFGLHAISLNNAAAAGCPAGRCTNDAASTSQRATTSADTSTVSFAIGAVGLGAAAALLLTRHPTVAATGVSAMAWPGGASIGWSTRF